MRTGSSRARAALVALLVTPIALASLAPGDTSAHPPNLDRFMDALGTVESSGDYEAVNPSSGAYGKYQIMPYNWGPWARVYLGDADAPRTPKNQEAVAAGKLHSLYDWLGSWKRVAYWWLTGSTKTSGWTDYASGYVRKVMGLYSKGTSARASVTIHRHSERSRAIDYGGRWVEARHGSYRGGAVRQASRAGQTATLTVTGRRVTWYGPTGPTRGKARIHVDGKPVATVDLYSRRFRPRTEIWTARWASSGEHTITIEVLGTKGRSVVAIDDLVAWE